MKLSADDTHFLEAIRGAPDDDAPRLVYADILQQRGSPWGELIAVQCALARLGRDGDLVSDERARLVRHERALLDGREEWWSTALGYPEVESFERGFPADVAFASAEELAAAAAALRHFPELAMIRVDLREGEVLRLFTIDRLPTRGLMLLPQAAPAPGYMFDALDAGVLARWLATALPALDSLHIDGEIEIGALQKLLASPATRGLRRLAIARTWSGGMFAPEVFATCAAQLTELRLEGCFIGGFRVEGYPALARLRSLSLVGMTPPESLFALTAQTAALRSLVARVDLRGFAA
jgi:uncharacterized protein (TIGR02996 family)